MGRREIIYSSYRIREIMFFYGRKERIVMGGGREYSYGRKERIVVAGGRGWLWEEKEDGHDVRR